MGGVLMDEQQRNTLRSAAYLATQDRLDLRGPRATRTGKTRSGKLNCTPPNVQCGGRCIPSNWDCRLKGQGTNSELSAHKTDPLAGIASLQRGAKDLARGVVTVDPSRVQRGRNSLIRGVVKLAPGDNLEQKKQLKRQLTAATTPIAAVLGVTLVGLSAHAGMKRGFESYRNGVGADIDRAAGRAIDAVLDRIPGVAGPRAATRAAAAGAAGDIATSALRGAGLERTRVATSGNLGRIGPLSFRPNAADTEASNLRSTLDTLNSRARSGGSSYDEWQRSSVQALYGAKSPGTRPRGQRGSIFSEHAANEFLISKFGLSGAGSVGPRGGFSMAARNALVDQQLGERLGSWGQALRSDMRQRRFVSADGTIRARDIDRYITEVGSRAFGARAANLTVAQQRQLSSEATRLMRSAIGGNPRLMGAEARSMRRALVTEYDTYFSGIAQGMRRNAVASDSPFGDGLTGLARYVSRTTNRPTPILSRDHADLILRHHYHTRVMRLQSDFTIGENTARRVAQTISRSPNLPDADSAYRILNENGFPRLARSGPATGRAPQRLRNLTELTSDILARTGNEGMSRAAAEREARRLIERRQR
jgi:hypothetical protein